MKVFQEHYLQKSFNKVHHTLLFLIIDEFKTKSTFLGVNLTLQPPPTFNLTLQPLSQLFTRLQKDRESSDFIIDFGSQKFYVHKWVLCSQWKYFKGNDPDWIN
jgi:hypothetical protein